MSIWKNVDMTPEGMQRMARKAFARRGVKTETRELFPVIAARYRTNGVTTLAVVTVKETLWPGDAGGFVLYGYGVSVRSVGDKFSELEGANRALRRALEGAATSVLHERSRPIGKGRT